MYDLFRTKDESVLDISFSAPMFFLPFVIETWLQLC
jgi:hypothetical protein